MFEIYVESMGFDCAIDITDEIRKVLAKMDCKSGVATIVVIGSTCSLSVMRYEPGAVADVFEMLEQVAPKKKLYRHEMTTDDPNGAAHLRSLLIGGSVHVPLRESAVALPDEHRIVLLDFDLRAAVRKVLVHIHHLSNVTS